MLTWLVVEFKLWFSFFTQYRFSDAKDSILLPLAYNFKTGIIGRAGGIDDHTFLDFGPKLDLIKGSFSTSRRDNGLIDNVLVTASSKETPPKMFGPGKLLVVLKHLASKTIDQLMN